MEPSPEKLTLFERLYEEEGEVVRWGRNFEPPEFADQEFLTEYRTWRLRNKELPRMREMTRFMENELAKERAQKSEGG
jgi:hypothetical protein